MPRLRILSWNIRGLAHRYGILRRLIEVVQPDLMCLQDLDIPNPYPGGDSRIDPRELLENLGFSAVALSALPPQEDWPQKMQSRWRGVAIASRISIEDSWSRSLAGESHGRHVAARLAHGITVHSALTPTPADMFGMQWHRRPALPRWKKARNLSQSPQFRQRLMFLSELVSEIQPSPHNHVVLCGGLGVAPGDNDVVPKIDPTVTPGCTLQERQSLRRLAQDKSMHDIVRRFLPNPTPLHSWFAGRRYHPHTASAFHTLSIARQHCAPRPALRLRCDHIWLSHNLARQCCFADIIEESALLPHTSDHLPLIADIEHENPQRLPDAPAPV